MTRAPPRYPVARLSSLHSPAPSCLSRLISYLRCDKHHDPSAYPKHTHRATVFASGSTFSIVNAGALAVCPDLLIVFRLVVPRSAPLQDRALPLNASHSFSMLENTAASGTSTSVTGLQVVVELRAYHVTVTLAPATVSHDICSPVHRRQWCGVRLHPGLLRREWALPPS
jgi:hypothetical protein